MGCIIINYVASNIFLSWNELRFTCHFAFETYCSVKFHF